MKINHFLFRDWAKLHHAYIISGANADLVWEDIFCNLSFKKRGNPDAYSAEYETFGIEEARTLSDWAILKPIAGEKKIAVIVALSFTTEAQNALLKLFEEPTSGTHFFIIVPNTGFILPTLLSRVRVISLKEEITVNSKFDSFFESSIADRLSAIASIIKSKDKEKARNLIKFLEQRISKVNPQEMKKYKNAEKILNAEKYIGARGASIRIILEYLAISL